jgi:hypothetical protein
VVAVKKTLCLVARHDWQQHVNKETSGPDGRYYLCSRCAVEKKFYFKPPTSIA